MMMLFVWMSSKKLESKANISVLLTFQYFKTEQSVPKMMVRDSGDDWETNGSLNMYDHSIAKAKEILAETPKGNRPSGSAARNQRFDY